MFATIDVRLKADAAANVRWFYAYRGITNFQLWMPIWVLYLQLDRGLSLGQILLLDGLFELMFLAFEVPTGVVADRWGRRRSMIFGSFVLVFAVALFAAAPGFWWVLLSYTVWAVALSLFSGADTALLHDSLVTQGREAEFSRCIGRGNAFAVGAMAVSAAIGAPLAALTDLWVPVYASIGLAALGVPVTFMFREPPIRADATNHSYRALLTDGVRLVARTPRLRSIIAVAALFQGIGFGAMLLMQPFLREHNVPIGAFGIVLPLLSAVAVVGALVAHRVASRLGDRRTVYAVLGGWVSALLLLALVDSVFALAFYALIRFSSNVFLPLAMNLINRDSPDHIRATVASIGSMAAGTVGATAKPIFGYVADARGIQSAFLVEGLLFAVLGGVAVFAWARIASKPRPAVLVDRGAVPAEV